MMDEARGPLLATPDQVAAEELLLMLLADPAVVAMQARLRAELAETPRGRTPDGLATLDRVIAHWANSALLGVIAESAGPSLYWIADNTPRSIDGRAFAGFGVCGDNPDFINRSAVLRPGCRYEVVGRLAPTGRRTAQWVMEHNRTGAADPSVKNLSRNKADMGNQIAMLTDRDLDLSASGTFRIPIEADEPSSLLFRDVRSDWRQRPSRLEVRQLDGPVQPWPGEAALRATAAERLQSFVHFWARYIESWFGGLAPNTISPTIERDRGWGFMAGFRFDLAADEAILLRKRDSGVDYFGAQTIDPWMITADARAYQNSLNPSQATPDEEGDVTSYIVSATDPGVANWLDTAGVHQGYGILRWQAVHPGTTREDRVAGYEVVKLSDVARLPGVARCTPEQRAERLSARRAGYESRLD